MVFSRDGSQLLVGNSPSVVSPFTNVNEIEVGALIDVETGKIRATLDNSSSRQAPLQSGSSAASQAHQPFFTADGKQFVLTDDNVIRTFDSTTGKPVLALRGHDNVVVACAEDPDGRLWSVEANGTLKQWSLKKPEPLRLAAQPVRNVGFNSLFALSADGAWVARAHAEPGEKPDEEKSIVELWDTAGKEEAKVFQKVGVPRGNRSGPSGRPNPIYVTLSADGRRVAMIRLRAYDSKTGKPIAPADLTVWNVASREEVFQTELPESAGTDALLATVMPMFSPDGATVSVLQRAQRQNILRLFDIKNRREKRAIQFGKADPRFLKFSSDGHRVAAVLQNSSTTGLEAAAKVVLCDLATGTQQEIAARVSGFDSRLAFSPDGKRLLVTYRSLNEYEINLYDTATGKQVGSLYTPDRSGVAGFGGRDVRDPTGPVFSPDGRRVAGITFSRQTAVIKVWDTESGKDLLSLPAPAESTGRTLLSSAIHLAFTPDNNRLVAVRTNGRLLSGSANDAQATPPITVTTYDATPRPEAKQP
jgi:WD40 repeat protein